MQRRKQDVKTQALIVLEGLKATPVPECGTEPQISQAQSDLGRDRSLPAAPKAFEVQAQSEKRGSHERVYA